MDHIDSKESDIDIDLESGGTTSEEDGSKNSSSSSELAKLISLDGSVIGGNVLGSYNKLWDSSDISIAEKKMLKEKRNKTSSKKPPKPPRPPRGPSLDAADMKLVREISELTLLKRKRIERMKTLKKLKSEKSSSFNSNLFAMVITLIFFFVIIFQGLLGSRV